MPSGVGAASRRDAERDGAVAYSGGGFRRGGLDDDRVFANRVAARPARSAIARALTALHADLGRPWTVAGLARQAGLSRTAFATRFSAMVGQGPMAYALGCRMRRAKAVLRGDHATEVVAAQVGYGSVAAFSAAFRRSAGTTPGAYKRQAQP